MNKSIKNGYFTIKNGEGKGKILHFSMNCWAELKSDTGKSVVEWSKSFYGGDTIDQALHLSEVIFAAAKAHDLEEGNEIDYNVYKVRNWVQSFTEKDSSDFVDAMGWAANINTGPGSGKK